MKTDCQRWVDLQVNGYGGVDFNSPGLTCDAVRAVVGRLAADGTAAFMPTIVTCDPEVAVANVRTIVAARKADSECARRILGFFFEGPFISPEPGAVGTHPVEWVHPPDIALFDRFQDAAEGLVRMVNVAAEIPGMPDFVRALSGRGVVVSLGHQMASTPDELEPCLAAGARAFTHLGNGIPNMIPRHDNVIFSALADDRATIMFIPDGHHLPDTMLKVYFRAVPRERLVAVSDAQYPAGMPPGEYLVCGSHARLEPSGLLWNPQRKCLVGATTPMARMMERLRSRIGVTPDDCRAIGHDNPLRLIGIDPTSIE